MEGTFSKTFLLPFRGIYTQNIQHFCEENDCVRCHNFFFLYCIIKRISAENLRTSWHTQAYTWFPINSHHTHLWAATITFKGILCYSALPLLTVFLFTGLPWKFHVFWYTATAWIALRSALSQICNSTLRLSIWMQNYCFLNWQGKYSTFE